MLGAKQNIPSDKAFQIAYTKMKETISEVNTLSQPKDTIMNDIAAACRREINRINETKIKKYAYEYRQSKGYKENDGTKEDPNIINTVLKTVSKTDNNLKSTTFERQAKKKVSFGPTEIYTTAAPRHAELLVLAGLIIMFLLFLVLGQQQELNNLKLQCKP